VILAVRDYLMAPDGSFSSFLSLYLTILAAFIRNSEYSKSPKRTLGQAFWIMSYSISGKKI
ncbi:MAG: hypothetical protein P8H03_00210, partial [Emcibacteraceae bacterium]|nr:hypothetical protein [Emcibacteraceae bacterium]